MYQVLCQVQGSNHGAKMKGAVSEPGPGQWEYQGDWSIRNGPVEEAAITI